jgi:hypothetical protein
MNNSVGGFGFVLKCFEIFDLDGHILGTVQRCLSFMRLSDKTVAWHPFIWAPESNGSAKLLDSQFKVEKVRITFYK